MMMEANSGPAGSRNARYSKRRVSWVLSGMVAMLVASSSWGALAAAPAKGAPAKSADAAQDPLFQQPYVDIDEWRDTPVRHRYVHGGFTGTDARFSIYFPPREQYQRRFFQHITPVPLSENLAQQGSGEHNMIGFSIASGGYFVESNEGGKSSAADPAIAGYRANAAVAKYSRVLAGQMYGPHRPYGYAFGGSGGGFKTISGFENTVGVWDGVVPFVIASPMAIPNVFTARTHALRVLKDKFPAIIDAVDVGGSGDMYAGLNQEERAALTEVTRMGFPPQTWFAYKSLGMGALSVLIDGVVLMDTKYFEDFWKVPGYLGANPPESLLRARIQHDTDIAGLVTAEEADKLGLPPPGPPAGAPRGGVDTAWKELQGQSGAGVPVAFALKTMPTGDLDLVGAKLVFKSGAATGKTLSIAAVVGNVVTIGFGIGDQSQILKAIKTGDAVQIDNSIYLAAQTYHRHQVPSSDYYVWNQFRGPDGKPLYPQRPFLVGPLMTGAGSIQTGRFEGKMIVVESLMDEAAFPWQADWYRSQVKTALGPRLDGNFRLWFTDHAMHTDVDHVEDRTRVVSYLGVLYQALRDLSAWVEKGVPPPASTSYKVVDGQVQVPPTAAERKGIQPVVTVKANGGVRAEVGVGQPVTFTAVVEVPPKTGKVVAAEWDFEGAGTYPVTAQLPKSAGSSVTLKTSYAFTKPGTYFPVLRAASQRQGDTKTPYARIQNLSRVRVVVR